MKGNGSFLKRKLRKEFQTVTELPYFLEIVLIFLRNQPFTLRNSRARLNLYTDKIKQSAFADCFILLKHTQHSSYCGYWQSG